MSGKAVYKTAVTGKESSRTTRQSRAKLIMPVARIKTYLKWYAPRVSVGTGAVFCTGSLERILTEVLKNAVDATRTAKLKRITPFTIQRGLWSDPQLYSFFKGVHIRQGGIPSAKYWDRIEMAKEHFDPMKPRKVIKGSVAALASVKGGNNDDDDDDDVDDDIQDVEEGTEEEGTEEDGIDDDDDDDGAGTTKKQKLTPKPT